MIKKRLILKLNARNSNKTYFQSGPNNKKAVAISPDTDN